MGPASTGGGDGKPYALFVIHLREDGAQFFLRFSRCVVLLHVYSETSWSVLYDILKYELDEENRSI